MGVFPRAAGGHGRAAASVASRRDTPGRAKRGRASSGRMAADDPSRHDAGYPAAGRLPGDGGASVSGAGQEGRRMGLRKQRQRVYASPQIRLGRTPERRRAFSSGPPARSPDRSVEAGRAEPSDDDKPRGPASFATEGATGGGRHAAKFTRGTGPRTRHRRERPGSPFPECPRGRAAALVRERSEPAKSVAAPRPGRSERRAADERPAVGGPSSCLVSVRRLLLAEWYLLISVECG